MATEEFTPGERVYYKPSPGEVEFGTVSSVNDTYVFVKFDREWEYPEFDHEWGYPAKAVSPSLLTKV